MAVVLLVGVTQEEEVVLLVVAVHRFLRAIRNPLRNPLKNSPRNPLKSPLKNLLRKSKANGNTQRFSEITYLILSAD